jgi:hypothetical protein
VESLIEATLDALLYQVPPEIVEVKVVVPATQMAWLPLRVPGEGGAVTVTVRVAVALVQPPVPALVYVIIAVPAAKPVTRPVDVFTVATPGALLDQIPPETVDVKVVVPPTHTAWFPLRVPTEVPAVTVTVRVAVAFAQPPVLVTV